MGLSASQGRLLTLTARKSNLEFQIQQTTQAKMLLANQLDTAATLWSDGMNEQHLYYSPKGVNSSRTEDLERLSYQLVTGEEEEGGLGMQVRDSYGRLVVPELPDPMPDDKTVGDYAIEPYCNQTAYFENNLKTGNWAIQRFNKDGWQDEPISGSTFIYQGVDSSDYKIANNDYEQKVAKLQRVDKKFDMRIQQLAAEQQAIETEMDSVKKVIDKNIEESFKTFG